MGTKARQILAEHQAGVVFGVTSRGVFVNVAGWVVFLSLEKFRGPLTVNINGDVEALGEVHPHDAVFFNPYQISISPSWLNISLHGAVDWSAPERTEQPLSIGERKEMLEWVSARVLPPVGAFRDGQVDLMVEMICVEWAGGIGISLDGLFGCGPGLTPAGDDVITGMLLAFNRWRELFPQWMWIETFSKYAVDQAYRQTTNLSASLIDCAAQGQADERLIEALDGLVTGTPGRERCVELLSGWGSTSGACALAGMRAALEMAGND